MSRIPDWVLLLLWGCFTVACVITGAWWLLWLAVIGLLLRILHLR